jgi:XisI protein
MVQIGQYRQCIQTLLTKYSQIQAQQAEVESQLLFDPVRDHYQLMRVGWNRLSRVYHVVMHFDIIDGKVWIQQNMTDIDVAQELVEAGIPKEDIVLGLHPTYKRQFTGYGVA